MLPSETADPDAEIEFGHRLIYLSIVWIVLTVLAGVFLIAIRPWVAIF